ncbi:hypothetical protein Dimus_025609 [Dionaea muscipula]
MLAKTRNELIECAVHLPKSVQSFLAARMVNYKLRILWRAMLGRLCTMDNLRWELVNRLCLFCGTEVETARSRRSGSRGTALRVTLAASAYYLWKARNHLLWNKIPFDPAYLVRKVKADNLVCPRAAF